MFPTNQIAISFKFTYARDFRSDCYRARSNGTAVTVLALKQIKMEVTCHVSTNQIIVSFKFTHARDFRSDLLSLKIY